MIIIELTYKKSWDDVCEFLSSHKSFIEKHIKLGSILTSGSKVPRDGGIILSNLSIDSAKELMKEDPFFIKNIADFKYIEFTESKHLK